MSHAFGEEHQEYIRDFLIEGKEHLDVLNQKLLEAESVIKNESHMSEDDLNAMFRAAHTIKGSASFIGLTKIEHLAHEMEAILQLVRQGKIELTLEIIDVLFFAFDTFGLLFQALEESNNDDECDIEESVQKIKSILSNDVPPKEASSSGKYLEEYLVESNQYIADFNELLVAVEKKHGEYNADQVNELFRLMHNIKGSAWVVKAEKITGLAHAMENILSTFRDKHQPLQPEIITLLFDGIDMIASINKSFSEHAESTADISGILDSLNEYYEKITGKQNDSKKVKAKPRNEFGSLVEVTLSDNELEQYKNVLQAVFTVDKTVMLKNIHLILVEEHLRKKGDLISFKHSPDPIEDKFDGEVTVGAVLGTDHEKADIKKTLNSIDGIKIVSLEPVSATDKKVEKPKPVLVEEVTKKTPEQKSKVKPKNSITEPDASKNVQAVKNAPIELSTIRIDSHKLDNLMNLSGELVIVRAQLARLIHMFDGDIALFRQIASEFEITKSEAKTVQNEFKELNVRTTDETDKVRKVWSHLEKLTEGLGKLEAHIAKNDVANKVHLLDDSIDSLGKIASSIQSGIMQTRMIPVEGVFTRFKRIVRDISKDLGKEVNLVIEGEDTELDKKIVDSLGDPLTHMIRNAIDHGVESPQARAEAGKPETGTVLLRASHKGNNICIEIGDDDKGLDPEKLAEVAVKKGLLTEEQTDALSEKEKMNLIFLPGFSSAQTVTGISGRGVGMDVVKNMITSVNGVVDINSTIGKGTVFTLKIPLTLAIIQVLLVSIGEEIYAVPLEAVLEIIKISDSDIYAVDGNPTIKLRNQVLGLVNIENVIHIKGKNDDSIKAKKVVVLTDGETQLGITVDSLIGEEEIVIKPLTEHFSRVKGITGASILGDGQVALILDPISIIKESK
ncbi:chemotaxis protein CheA [bacterium]|nr:chemotaxis protein CheA [bacterium]